MQDRERNLGSIYSGIMFSKEHRGIGMDLLLDSGPVRAWPGGVYTLSTRRLEAIVHLFEEKGLNYSVNFNLPDLPPMPWSVEWPLGRRLGELDGWHRPNQDELEKLKGG